MNFTFKWQEQYNVSHECTQRMNEILFLSLEHKIHISELTSNVLFITYRHTDDGVYDDFPKFPTTFQRFSITVLKTRQTFPNIFQKFRNIAEDFRKRPEDVSMIHQ